MTSTARRTTAAPPDIQPTLLDEPGQEPGSELEPARSGFAALAVEDLLDAAAAARAGAAQQAVSDFSRRTADGHAGIGAEAVAAVLARVEAVCSSRIEQVEASARQVALAELEGTENRDARLVLGNLAAIEAALQQDEASTAVAVALQRRLFAGTTAQVGVRHQPVWIAPSGSPIAGAHFVPVDHTLVPGQLDDLWRFAAAPSLLPLAQAGVSHAQFESIHPFVDGNGRVGRALIQGHLRRAGLLPGALVPVSAGLLCDLEGYFTALGAFRAGNATPIVDVLAHAVHAGIGVGTALLDELQAVRNSWTDRIRARRDSVAWRIADRLLSHPATTAETAAARHGVSPVAARTAMATLLEAGVVAKASEGRRNQVWVAEEVTGCYDRVTVLIGHRRDQVV